MKFILILVICFSLGKMLWRLILKKSAYPEHIPTKLKVTHAIILFYVLIAGLSGFYSLLSDIIHPTPTTWETDSPVGAFIGPAIVLYGVAGTALLFVCSNMAKRQRKALKWFFVLWPITTFSSSYIAAVREQGHLPMQAIYFGAVFSIVIFAMTIVFYLRRSTKIIFDEIKSI
jgi:hypothetical protein